MTQPRGLAALLVLGTVVAACAPAAPVTASPALTAPPALTASPTGATASASAPGAPGADDWPAYHRDAARTGAARRTAPFTNVDVAWQAAVDGDVYAEPLVVGTSAIVATERNIVYAFDVRTGAQRWRTTLGAPVAADTLICGNIRPWSGITGTPVADARAGLVYVVAFETPFRHVLYALELATGGVRFQRPVDAPGADPSVHQQRAALALANGYVYVAYGGLIGDCGQYRGTVVAAPASSASGDLLVYRVPAGREAGIWAPSGMAVDADGRVYAATGNSDTSGAFDYNDSVLRLSPTLVLEDYWAPRDWLALSRGDVDLGSVGPTLLPNGLLLQGGKNGVVYLLRAADLGKIGGELARLQVCSGVYGGFAFAAGVAYVPCDDGVAAVAVSDTALRVLWRGPRGATGPPIVAGGAVWVPDPAAGAIYALDLADGRVRAQRSIGAMPRFTTPTAFDDLILVAAGGRLVALRMS